MSLGRLLLLGQGTAHAAASEQHAVNRCRCSSPLLQFVPLKEAQQKGGHIEVTKQLLAEIPGQVVEYYDKIRGIQPPPPPSAPPAPVM